MSPHPGPLHLVQSSRLRQLFPESQVLDRAGLPGPTPGGPAGNPFAHSLHQVFGIGHYENSQAVSFAGEQSQGRCRAEQCHPIVGGMRRVDVEVPPLDLLAAPGLDESAGSTRILPLPAIAQAALVQVNHRDAAHSIT
jgi:hypothetical protein